MFFFAVIFIINPFDVFMFHVFWYVFDSSDDAGEVLCFYLRKNGERKARGKGGLGGGREYLDENL